jgi:hypothetical protein
VITSALQSASAAATKPNDKAAIPVTINAGGTSECQCLLMPYSKPGTTEPVPLVGAGSRGFVELRRNVLINYPLSGALSM